MPSLFSSDFDLTRSQEDDGGGEGYKYFMRNEPPQVDSDIQTDPETGRRFSYWKIGMVRNSKDENRKRVKIILDPYPHMLINSSKPLQGWYKGKFEPIGVRPRPCMTDAVLTEPYGGYCNVSCRHCYIDYGLRGYRGQGVTTVPVTFAKDVSKQLRKIQTSAAGYFSSFTDPFQPIEDIYHNSQGGASAFVNEGLPIFFLTRLRYPEWAFDLLRKNKYSYAQMSINTSNAEDWRRMSPRALSLEDMLDQVTALHKAGIYVSIQVNPIIGGAVSNDDIVGLIHTLAQRGADHLIFKFVEISFPAKPSMIANMKQAFGDARGALFESLFTCNIGGQVTIDEEYRLKALNRFKRECQKAKVTMATCYEYKFVRDRFGVITNRTGVSVGREYLTGEQCHGHRVPLFTRRNPDSRFEEVSACPPSGCLYCADDSPQGKVPCGSNFFGSAPAWDLKDMKTGVYGDERIERRPDSGLVQIKRII